MQIIPPYIGDIPHEKLEAAWKHGQQTRAKRAEARRTKPLIRIWDGNWNYVGTVTGVVIEARTQRHRRGYHHITYRPLDIRMDPPIR